MKILVVSGFNFCTNGKNALLVLEKALNSTSYLGKTIRFVTSDSLVVFYDIRLLINCVIKLAK